MEDLKTSFDTIFKEYKRTNKNFQESKRLSDSIFGDGGQNKREESKKRKNMDDDDNDQSPVNLTDSKKQKTMINGNDMTNTLNDSSLNRSSSIINISSPNISQHSLQNLTNTSIDGGGNNTSSFNSSDNIAAWEMRMLKAELITYKATLAQSRRECQTRIDKYTEMEKMYLDKIHFLEVQKKKDSEDISKQKKFLTNLRDAIAGQRSKVIHLEGQLERQDMENSKKLNDFKNETETQQQAITFENIELKARTQLAESTVSKLEEKLSLLNEKLTTLERNKVELENRTPTYDCIKRQLDDLSMRYEMSEQKCRQMEMDMKEFSGWEETSKKFISTLARVQDLEQENDALKRDRQNLIDNIKGKLILEEKNAQLKNRVEQLEKHNCDNVQLKTQMGFLNNELKEWKHMANDFLDTSHGTPRSLHKYIIDMQENSLLLTNDQGNATTEKDTINKQLQNVKQELAIYIKNFTTQKSQLEVHRNNIMKLQKKLLLVARERDCFKNLLENYEKDLTITAPHTNETGGGGGLDTQMRLRLEMVEKSLVGYKEMCSTLEKELAKAKVNDGNVGDNGDDFSEENKIVDTFGCYQRLKNECELKRTECERLRDRNDKLETMLELINVKNVNASSTKIVHMKDNPAAIAEANHTAKVEKLYAEIARLKQKINDFESITNQRGDNILTTNTKSNENAMDCIETVNVREMMSLKEKVESLELRNKHTREQFHTHFEQLNAFCGLAYGYKFENVLNEMYTISSVFAENENEFLILKLNDVNSIDMLDSPYLRTLTRNNTLETPIPLFLSNLTLDLFGKTTFV